MTQKARQGSILNAIRVEYFPRGIRRFCGDDNAEAQLDWWIERLRNEIKKICDGQAADDDTSGSGVDDDGHYYCMNVATPQHGDGCYQKVCWDEYGNVVYRGPVQCPPQQP